MSWEEQRKEELSKLQPAVRPSRWWVCVVIAVACLATGVAAGYLLAVMR